MQLKLEVTCYGYYTELKLVTHALSRTITVNN